MPNLENKILSGLNEPQRQAVCQLDGPVLVIAGAGSGKTKTLTHRVAYLTAQGIKPNSIVTLTFTNKAAQEMKTRIIELLRPAPGQILPFIGTFHKFALSILSLHAPKLGYQSRLTIYDEIDSQAAMKQALEKLGLPDNPRATYQKLSFLKNRGDTLNQTDLPQRLRSIIQAYEQTLRENSAVDFDNIILKTIELLQKDSRVLDQYLGRYTHFLVDEYQDTNQPQYQLLRLLTQKHNNICVVGDDWQSIYGFRSADYRILLNFEQDWPRARVFYLEQNYRSTQNILDASHGVICKNVSRTEKKLFTRNPNGSPILITQFIDEQQEALWLKEKLFSLLADKTKLSQMAILFRTNVQSRIFEDLCIEERIPYQLIGAFKFYRRKEVLDILAYLRVIYNSSDGAALERIINVPPRGIGAVSLNRLKQNQWDPPCLDNPAAEKRVKIFFALIDNLRRFSQNSKVKDLIAQVARTADYKAYLDPETDQGQERWENIQELMRIAEVFPEPGLAGLEKFLQTIQLMQDTDELDNSAEKLTLMTLHSAKGLEFEAVFISGLEEGLLPHRKSLAVADQLEEERRLLYVGMTRARTKLFLTLCQTRYLRGSLQYNLPSRFLRDIPGEYAEFIYQDASQRRHDNRDGLLYEFDKQLN
jgi:DNA helicase-2/ATP-dependent DNA helicase PcrA